MPQLARRGRDPQRRVANSNKIIYTDRYGHIRHALVVEKCAITGVLVRQ